MMSFKSGQSLNSWVEMLDALYGGSQNYSKTPFEIHAHLTEVCGIFAKHLFKKNDPQTALEFLPKIFAWSVALFRKMYVGRNDLEQVILRKFPGCCSYCLKKPCSCWTGEKPSLSEGDLSRLYFRNATSIRRSVNEFQLMFREIYSVSWRRGDEGRSKGEILNGIFIRLIEEVAEVGEAMRFHHLFPENLENEIADLFAWWFALVSEMPGAEGGLYLGGDLLWRAYPGQCQSCKMIPCLCRPGPVRQLMSRPVPGDGHRFDMLTSAYNQAAYKEDVEKVVKGEISLSFPSACVRLDVDNFKAVNDNYGHAAGDEALRHIASVLRRTIRERDRLYRISGDEFGVLCADFTEEEAAGSMRRACFALQNQPVRWVAQDGNVAEFTVSVSIGVSELSSPDLIEAAFHVADKAAYVSKEAGKGRVSKASELGGDAEAMPEAVER